MDIKHIAVLVLMLATAAVLIAGVSLMMVGGKLNDKYGRKLMVARVGLQALTVLLIGALFMMGK
jgi:MFS family permease